MNVIVSLIRSIINKVQIIITTKTNLRNSIIGKQVNVPEEAKLSEYPSYVDKILISGIETNDANAKTTDLRKNSTAYVKGNKITGEVPTRTAADIEIDGATVRFPAGIYDANEEATIPGGTLGTLKSSGKYGFAWGINNSTGKVSALCDYSGGYSGKTSLSDEYQLNVIKGQTFNPTDQEQIIVPAGTFTIGDIKIGASVAPEYNGTYGTFVPQISANGKVASIFLPDSFRELVPKAVTIMALDNNSLTSKYITSIHWDNDGKKGRIYYRSSNSAIVEGLIDGDVTLSTSGIGVLITLDSGWAVNFASSVNYCALLYF